MRLRAWLAVGAVALVVLVAWREMALAQNSLGIGRPEQAVRPEGFFGPLLMWIRTQQEWFYGLMRGELSAMRGDGRHVWTLIGLSFLYGIFHAAGPGHGKAVISSYMIANEVAARRGIVLSFASAFAQALTAIVVIAGFAIVLRGLGLRVADATRWLEIASYGAVTLLGAWLLWSKLTGRGHHHGHEATGHGHGHHDHGHGHAHQHGDHHGHAHHDHDHHGHAHAHAAEHGDDHLHAPDPAMLKGDFGLRQAWSAILAVGLRPCSGALIVLTFAFLNGLYVAGIASTFAMAVGTGLTVALLAALAVWAKDVAIRVGGAADRAATVHRVIEIAGAAFVLIIGATLLAASLY